MKCISGRCLFLLPLLVASVDETPIDKILTLLKDLQTQLETDGDNEKAIYDKYKNWCDETDTRKTKAIDDAERELQKLGTEILENKAKVAARAADMKELSNKIAGDETEQNQATVVRTKEHDEYMKAKGQMESTLQSLDGAIAALRTSFLQTGTSSHTAAQKMQAVLANVPTSRLAALPPKHLVLLRTFSRSVTGMSRASYNPQSATIVGILKQMFDQFVQDLEKSTMDEASAQRTFDELIESTNGDLHLNNKILREKKEQKAEAARLLSEALEAHENTDAQKNTDTEFLADTKKACAEKKEVWEERNSMREEELDGVNQALDILTSPENKKKFEKSFKKDDEKLFLQIASSSPQARDGAFKVLKEYAKMSHSIRLAQVAAKVMIGGPFNDVIKIIDDMVVTLEEEAKEDKERRDQCKEDYHRLATEIAEANHNADVSANKIEKLTEQIESLEQQISDTNDQISKANDDIDDLTKQRNSDHDAFVQARKDDEAAIEVLKDATKTLEKFYEKNTLLQIGKGPEFKRSKDQAPDAEFSDKGSRKQKAGGILTMMMMVTESLQKDIREAEKEETAAFKEFQSVKGELDSLKELLTNKKTQMEQSKGAREQDKLDEEKSKDEHEKSADDSKKEKEDISESCDSILEQFHVRAQARQNEMTGLEQAKAKLGGAR